MNPVRIRDFDNNWESYEGMSLQISADELRYHCVRTKDVYRSEIEVLRQAA